MIAYLDTSIVLRRLFSEPNGLKESPKIRKAYASRLLVVELGRVLDRMRLAGKVTDADIADLREGADHAVASIALLELSAGILRVASGSLPTALGTLDAIHLATALQVREETDRELIFATHDVQLAIAARASGFRVIGV